ncbi:hypothetical protein B0T14DRAFT_491901 [Immersiella caudata]|uniref:Uncharacterized protein n=1 Tax=Immersiella caudata TaxID=314043 RepID=A0AA39XH29_9PEZI|nr:hypothetical protein B0T14DRAFT_491901 [Immersiella caudata]
MDCAVGALQLQEILITIPDNMGMQDAASAAWQMLSSSCNLAGLGLTALFTNKRFLGATAAMVTLVFVAKPITVAIIEAENRKRDSETRENIARIKAESVRIEAESRENIARIEADIARIEAESRENIARIQAESR